VVVHHVMLAGVGATAEPFVFFIACARGLI